MTLSAALLAILVSLPVHKSDRDEPPDDRRARLTELATEIAMQADVAACRDMSDCKVVFADRLVLAGSLLELFRSESALSQRVFTCQCERFECDPITRRSMVYHQARGLGQAHRFGLAARYWDQLCGSAYYQVRVAAAHLAGAITTCGSLAGGFSRYGTGAGCVAPLGLPRAKRAEVWIARLRREVTE